ncbi:MAG: pyridine nucleotide-disulfide oxidoreductase [Betaproteobacteria bacterium]|nr:MAG: pyridine nucleotide-disulfide oxidoreductase [Betaproteobacteria bacterium]
MSSIVIVGSGLAGWTAVRELRKLDRAVRVTLVTADSGDFYSKPMLSNALAQGKTPDQLVGTSADAMAAQQGVALLRQTRVSGIDRARRLLLTDRGEVPYSQLVLALGADPIRLPLGGDAADAVLSVNDLSGYARFRAELDGARHVAILGAGLIGCEFANDLAAAGHAVTVLDPAAWPLASLLPEAAGRALIAPLEKLGVDWRLGNAVAKVDRAANGYRLTLGSGETLDADLVLSAVGLRPRIALAQAAGLAVNRGIVTDALLRTSDADVFALGDCAEIEGQTRPYVLPIMHASRALAQTLAGTPTAVAFPPMPVVIKTPACPVAVQPVARDTKGSWDITADDGGVRGLFYDADARLLGFALTQGYTDERAALTKLLA